MRNTNMADYFEYYDNQFEAPIRAFSDTALATKTEDSIPRPQMRSSMTTGNIVSLKNGQPYKEHIKKKVSIDNCVRVILITSRAEYMQAGLFSSLWYKHEDYIEFKKETLKELASTSIDILRNVSCLEGHDQLNSPEDDGRQMSVDNKGMSNGGLVRPTDIDEDNTFPAKSVWSNLASEKRTSISCASGLDKLAKMYKNDSNPNGDEGNSRGDHVLNRPDSSDGMTIESELINTIVERGEEKARKQALLSRRLAEEQLNNKQFIAKNPLTLMCS